MAPRGHGVPVAPMSTAPTTTATLVLWGSCFVAMSVSHVWWDLLIYPLNPPDLPHGHLLIGYHELLDFLGVVMHSLFLRFLLRRLHDERHPSSHPGVTQKLIVDVATATMCIGVGIHTSTNSLHTLVNPGNEYGAVRLTRVNQVRPYAIRIMHQSVGLFGNRLCSFCSTSCVPLDPESCFRSVLTRGQTHVCMQ